MHPELLNNSLFLKYYKQWQDDPYSIVFAPIADYFLMYGMVDDAMKVCREGLKRHPNLVSGRIVMAKVHLKRGNWDEAEAELTAVLSIVPDNQTAREMLATIDGERKAEGAVFKEAAERVQTHAERDAPKQAEDESWQTVTMADIFARQGHNEKARKIYLSVLSREPHNEAARRGIELLPA
jgi:predicted Zn-dependent protease